MGGIFIYNTVIVKSNNKYSFYIKCLYPKLCISCSPQQYLNEEVSVSICKMAVVVSIGALLQLVGVVLGVTCCKHVKVWC